VIALGPTNPPQDSPLHEGKVLGTDFKCESEGISEKVGFLSESEIVRISWQGWAGNDWARESEDCDIRSRARDVEALQFHVHDVASKPDLWVLVIFHHVAGGYQVLGRKDELSVVPGRG